MGPIPDFGPLLRFLVVFAVIGVIAAVISVPWFIWWLISHLRWVS